MAKQNIGQVNPAPAHQLARSRQEGLEEARESLEKAARRMKKYADRNRIPLEFQVGDQVLLKLTPQIWKKVDSKTRHRSLIPRYDGPFEVLKRVGQVAYRLKLPDRLNLHTTFHVSFLKTYHGDLDAARVKKQRAPPLVIKEFDQQVEQISDHRTMGASRKNRRTDYLVKWRKKEIPEATWERNTTL